MYRLAFESAEEKRISYIRIDTVSGARGLELLAKKYEALGDYYDSSEKAQYCYTEAASMRKRLCNEAIKLLENAKTINDVSTARRIFSELGTSYEDTKEKIILCDTKKTHMDKIAQLNEAKGKLKVQEKSIQTALEWEKLAKDYKIIDDDACKDLSSECLNESEKIYNTLYSDADEKYKKAKTIAEFREAMLLFEDLEDYKDSYKKVDECKKGIAALQELEKENERKHAAARTRMMIFFAIILLLIGVGVFVFLNIILPEIKYKQGLESLESNEPQKAKSIFAEIINYRDSIKRFKQAEANTLYNEGKYKDVWNIYDVRGTP